MLLRDLLGERKLILASRSPRRRTLLEGCGLKFMVAEDYDVEEAYPAQLPVNEVPTYLARVKSEAYPWTLADGDILITADTVVILEGTILGKPADGDEAVAMLEKLSNRAHTVLTGVCLRSWSRCEVFSVATRVWFRRLTREEIEYYVTTYRPMDKAGSYGIQEWIGHIGIERIEGSFYNVMGLPVQTLYSKLEDMMRREMTKI